MEIKIVRKMDEAGRIVISKDVRTTLNFQNRGDIEIVVENGAVVLRKAEEKR